jgi:pyridoxamine 5'-phosphate oxidase
MAHWLADLRPAREDRALADDDVDPNPFAQFGKWLDAAHEAGIVQPNGMTLSTVDDDGPDARIVLLKGFDERGFVFYTHRTSHKGRQLDAAKAAALTFWWDPLERQVRVRGRVEWVTDAESDEYFQSRPRGSQLGAIVSAQSEVVTRPALEDALAELEARTLGDPLPRPATWGGYRIVPWQFEFWQGRANRLHDRIRYRRTADEWTRERLAP